MQLHLEFREPVLHGRTGQDRGNSGVFLMGRYEIQVLDCYQSKTYADGSTGGIYGQHPPLVNACRPPGEWQTYDIIFNVPHFDADGKLLTPGYATVIQNGVVVQNHQAIRRRHQLAACPANTTTMAQPARSPCNTTTTPSPSATSGSARLPSITNREPV